MSTLQTPSRARRRGTTDGRVVAAALATAAVFAAEAVVAALFPVGLEDHSAGAGRVSEALAGIGFLAAALTLALAARDLGRFGRGAAVVGVLGCAAMGVAQVVIAGTGEEWPDPVVTVIVLAALVGMAGQAAAAALSRRWPWLVAVPVGLTVLVLFLVPSPANSAVIAASFAALGIVTRRRDTRG